MFNFSLHLLVIASIVWAEKFHRSSKKKEKKKEINISENRKITFFDILNKYSIVCESCEDSVQIKRLFRSISVYGQMIP